MNESAPLSFCYGFVATPECCRGGLGMRLTHQDCTASPCCCYLHRSLIWTGEKEIWTGKERLKIDDLCETGRSMSDTQVPRAI